MTGPDGEPIGGLRVFIIGGTAPFPEIAPETNDAGLYQIAGVPPGTLQVAVNDRQGEGVGVEFIDVRSGEKSTLNFSISTDATRGEGDDPVSAPVSGVGPGISIGEALASNLTGPLLINAGAGASFVDQDDQRDLPCLPATGYPPFPDSRIAWPSSGAPVHPKTFIGDGGFTTNVIGEAYTRLGGARSQLDTCVSCKYHSLSLSIFMSSNVCS